MDALFQEIHGKLIESSIRIDVAWCCMSFPLAEIPPFIRNRATSRKYVGWNSSKTSVIDHTCSYIFLVDKHNICGNHSKKTSIKKNNNNFPSDCGIPLALSWNLSHGKSIENIGARSKFITENRLRIWGWKPPNDFVHCVFWTFFVHKHHGAKTGMLPIETTLVHRNLQYIWVCLKIGYS